MKPIKKCQCGCNRDAQYICEGFEFDPRKPENRGLAFIEYACSTATAYMEESSYELNLLPFTKTLIKL